MIPQALCILAFAAAAGAAIFQTVRVRRLAARLEQAEDRADRAVHARDTFFDLATHELRSPLAAVLGYQELLADGAYGDLPPTAAEPVTRIGRSAHHLLHLIDGVVELSRLKAGGVQPDLEPVNTAVLVSGIAEAFRTHTRDRGIEPRVRMPERLPTISSDPDRLLRALDLLITSAVKHPADSTLHLDVETDGRTLELRIHPTELVLGQTHDDDELRLGIRIAVARHVATLLGGGLDLEPQRQDPAIIGALRFRVRDLPPSDSPTPHL